MTLIVESALRSLLLGLLAGAVLKLLRVRDTATETLIWTSVLAVALAMPLLTHCIPRLVLAMPRLADGAALLPPLQLPAVPRASPALLWLRPHGQLCLLAVYGAGVLVCLMRLLAGLVLTWRLYLHAVPIQAEWARARRIRVSDALRTPASLARTILLPADFMGWSGAKLQAVLAHEAAHIARRDFFVHLAAAVHCAVFWFSPFAWWLRSKLAEVAESASDEAAARRLNDPFMYAEILLDVARGAGGASLTVAMAKSPLIQQRIERLIGGTATTDPGVVLRLMVMAALSLATVALASATVAVGADLARAASAQPSHAAMSRTAATASSAVSRRAAPARRRARHVIASWHQVTSSAPAPRRDALSYNPRALLDPMYTPARPYVPASTIEHAGRTYYIRSTGRVVAEVAPADGTYRSAQ